MECNYISKAGAPGRSIYDRSWSLPKPCSG